MKLKLNLYPAVENLQERIVEVIRTAKKNRARVIEIAYGKASAETKKQILRILEKKQYRRLYNRLEKSKGGWGRIYLHFRWRKRG
ncbi:MAG: DNA mismatch repair protein MutS [Candidatus Omnitrophica bacterium]|nr:DNA mismatch repair protein MutS [Candidatus Omnitrophota bacterium]